MVRQSVSDNQDHSDRFYEIHRCGNKWALGLLGLGVEVSRVRVRDKVRVRLGLGLEEVFVFDSGLG